MDGLKKTLEWDRRGIVRPRRVACERGGHVAVQGEGLAEEVAERSSGVRREEEGKRGEQRKSVSQYEVAVALASSASVFPIPPSVNANAYLLSTGCGITIDTVPLKIPFALLQDLPSFCDT